MGCDKFSYEMLENGFFRMTHLDPETGKYLSSSLEAPMNKGDVKRRVDFCNTSWRMKYGDL